MVEESIHVKFNDREHDYHMSKPLERFADIQVSEDHQVAGPSEIRSSEDGGQMLDYQKLVQFLKLIEDSEETFDGS